MFPGYSTAPTPAASFITTLIICMQKYEDDFVKLLMDKTRLDMQKKCKRKQQELHTFFARDRELDDLFVRIYEDNVGGKLTDAHFQQLSTRYDAEQVDIKEQIDSLQAELDTNEQHDQVKYQTAYWKAIDKIRVI